MEPFYDDLLRRGGTAAVEHVATSVDPGGGLLHTLHRVARALDRARIPYAVAGDMASAVHGHVCTPGRLAFVVDVPIQKAFADALLPIGVQRSGGEGFRDEETKVPLRMWESGRNIARWTTVKLRPVAGVFVTADAVRYLSLPALVEWKLVAAGAGVSGDLADAFELIISNRLTTEFADRLHVDVRGRFVTLAREAAALGWRHPAH